MPMNLFAACRASGGQLSARRIRLNDEVQEAMEELFLEQEATFQASVVHETPFDERWRPEPGELSTIPVADVADEVEVLRAALSANAISLDTIDIARFHEEGIKAVFATPSGGGNRILVQRFIASQVLSRKFTLVEVGNTFRQLTDTAFTLAGSLTCIIDDDQIKFKSFPNLRSIFRLTAVFRAATENEVKSFAGHHIFEVSDMNAFVDNSDEVARKLIHAITLSGVLNHNSPHTIQSEASSTGLEIEVHNQKIVLPTDRREMKSVLQFLDDSRYVGRLTGFTYVTNSRRRVT